MHSLLTKKNRTSAHLIYKYTLNIFVLTTNGNKRWYDECSFLVLFLEVLEKIIKVIKNDTKLIEKKGIDKIQFIKQ